MKTHFTLEFFKNFSENEIEDFENFLNSPYHVKLKSIPKLFKEIIRNRDLLMDSSFELLINKLANDLKISKTTLNQRFSFLGNAVFDYLKVKACFLDTFSSGVILNDYLENNKLFTLLKKNIDNISLHFIDTPKVNERTYINSFFENAAIFTFMLQDTKLSGKRGVKPRIKYLDVAVKDIFLFLIIQLSGIYVNYIALTLNESKNNNFTFPVSLINLFESYEKFYSTGKSGIMKSVFNIYKSMFLAFRFRDNKKYYLEYKYKVENCSKYLSKPLINFQYKELINFCILKDRLGEEQDYFRKEKTGLLFKYFNDDIYKIYNNDFINCTEYTNFIGTAYSAGKFKILKSFVDKNSSKLNPPEAKDMINYGYAYYYLGIKNYRKALRCIADIKFYYCYYKHNIKNIELRLYYELNQFEHLRESIHNYRAEILNDNLLTKSDRNSLLKLIKYLQILIRINNIQDNVKCVFEAGFYKRALEKETSVALKQWLIEKFDEIIYTGKSIQKVE